MAGVGEQRAEQAWAELRRDQEVARVPLAHQRGEVSRRAAATCGPTNPIRSSTGPAAEAAAPISTAATVAGGAVRRSSSPPAAHADWGPPRPAPGRRRKEGAGEQHRDHGEAAPDAGAARGARAPSTPSPAVAEHQPADDERGGDSERGGPARCRWYQGANGTPTTR